MYMTRLFRLLNICLFLAICIISLASVGCKTLPGKLLVIQSTYSPPVVPADPKGQYEISVFFTLQNIGENSIQVQRLRTSSSSSMTSEPTVPCNIDPGQTIKVSFNATTIEQKVTRYAWVETSSDRVELKVTLDPKKMRAAVEAAKQDK
ncbi:MAG: hypothetical protein RL692_389 [Planctomycetota bacterium]